MTGVLRPCNARILPVTVHAPPDQSIDTSRSPIGLTTSSCTVYRISSRNSPMWRGEISEAHARFRRHCGSNLRHGPSDTCIVLGEQRRLIHPLYEYRLMVHCDRCWRSFWTISDRRSGMTGSRSSVMQYLFGAKSFWRLVGRVGTIVHSAPSPLRKRTVQMRERHRLRQNAADTSLHVAALIVR